MTPEGVRHRPALLGTVGLLVIAVTAVLTFFLEDLPFFGGGEQHTAEFAEAAGLRVDDEVRVAGLKVGAVTDVGLRDGRVLVTFRVSGVELGDRSRAEIRIKTLLGQKYLALDSEGRDPLTETIPVERTTSPYDVIEAFSGLSTTVRGIDTDQLAQSFRVLSDAFRDSPAHVKQALDGLSSLSRTISSRDEQLASLIEGANQVSGALADRNKDFAALITDGNLLLEEIGHRRDAIARLLDGTRALSRELSGLVADNNEQLRPALENLERVTDVLRNNQEALDRGLALAGPYYRVLNNSLGNGRWVDTHVCGLVVDPGARRDCPTGGR
ncbi:phospholipid/cholesterol/gamma-HCH transport system substrate-binding protein [Saccharothrix saharensis]|uniref:Phospholipid/cholesterol/gamma-HCH transport system substrate-binding protein n=1 Tax=Saccharothrix saharensis TaxID=571190 RepID=A0A543JPC7_9PSEU|nr:phospholipid/cholesterol/gamma-HCH transport system substrate-binding protein [Saccharothrix saharensis]